MAKQTGPIMITGTLGDYCYYRLGNQYYVRRKGAVTAKKFKTDKAFKNSRKCSKLFGQGSRLASEVYRDLKTEERKHSLFRQLQKRAWDGLKEGKKGETVLLELKKWVQSYLQAARRKARK